MRNSTKRKYIAIQDRFKHLYDVERKRIDDVETSLCEQFFLSRSRLQIILKMNLVEESA